MRGRWEQFRGRLTYANVVATLALFVALGGGSYAAVSITGADVRDSSLTGRDVRNSSLTGRDVKNSSLGTRDIKNATLLAADFKPGQLPAGARGPQGFPGVQGPPGPSTGPAGGDLTGNYPNPLIGARRVTPDKIGTIPAVSLGEANPQAIPNTNATAVEFNIENFDTANMHSGTNPSRVTAPIDGLYAIAGTAYFASNATGFREVGITRNGLLGTPPFVQRTLAISGGAVSGVNVGGLLRLLAGQYVELEARQTSGADLNVLGSGANASPALAVYWVGPAS